MHTPNRIEPGAVSLDKGYLDCALRRRGPDVLVKPKTRSTGSRPTPEIDEEAMNLLAGDPILTLNCVGYTFRIARLFVGSVSL